MQSERLFSISAFHNKRESSQENKLNNLMNLNHIALKLIEKNNGTKLD